MRNRRAVWKIANDITSILNGYLLVKRNSDIRRDRRRFVGGGRFGGPIRIYCQRRPKYESNRRFKTSYHYDAELGVSSYESNNGGGPQYVIDDFLNAGP